jgi:hypothetical protein
VAVSRSATFCLGVTQILAERGLLRMSISLYGFWRWLHGLFSDNKTGIEGGPAGGCRRS